MMTLRVSFHRTFLCLAGSPRAAAEAWAASFGPGFSTGLLTLQQNTPWLIASGTLYVQAPDNVTPDTFGFLARNWTRDCIVVDAIAVVDAPPPAGSEQAAVDAANPGIAGATKSFLDTLATLGKDAVFLVVAVLVLFLLVETGALKRLGGKQS